MLVVAEKKEEKPPRLPAETKSGPLKALSRILSPPNPNRVSPARSTQALTTTSKPFLLLQFLYLSLSSLLFLSLFFIMQAFRRNTLSAVQNVAAVQRRGYARAAGAYAETVPNLRINADTKVLFQGFTGKQGT